MAEWHLVFRDDPADPDMFSVESTIIPEDRESTAAEKSGKQLLKLLSDMGVFSLGLKS